jgi:hypothetical protein
LNTVNITDQGSGAHSVEWNGNSAHEISGVHTILVQAARAGHDKINIQLGSMIDLASAVPSASTGRTRTDSVAIRAVKGRTSGTAIQTGSLLTIKVTSPKINTIALESWNNGLMVDAKWNGGGVHSFSGVETIVIDIKNSSRAFVGLDEVVTQG